MANSKRHYIVYFLWHDYVKQEEVKTSKINIKKDIEKYLKIIKFI